MDEDTHELISHLSTRIGIIMEDASVIALTPGHVHPVERPNAIIDLTRACETISRLMMAVQALDS